jgi:hypothetical protein
VCYKLVEKCKDEDISSLVQVSNLRQEAQGFSQALGHLQDHLVETHGFAYLDFVAIKKTLETCNDSLEKYQRLQGRLEHSPNLGTGSRYKRLWGRHISYGSQEVGARARPELGFSSWDGFDELQVSQATLARHRQALVLYLQILNM